jgi:DNA helicase II / ATP-dependent DNA helicase PcrA
VGRLRAPTREQAAVIRLDHGPARVLAGAGSGKTFTMTELVSYRVGEHLRRLGGTAPERILALTFTVKAADEMRSRLISRLGEQALKLTVANFHSYALQIVRENAAMLNLEPDAPVLRRGRAWLMVLDELAARDLTLRRLDLSDPAGAADKVLTLLSQAKNDLVDLRTLKRRTEEDLSRADTDGLLWVFEERLDLIELAQRFEIRRTARGLLRYEDMIELGARVLEDPIMGETYTDRYEFVVVDEFQDTNPAQLRFVELLAGGDLSKVVVIGDDLQSIYNFTGASVRNIQRFEEEAGVDVGSRTFPLAVNFRSGERILALANHIARAVHPESSPDEPKILLPREGASPGHIDAFACVSDTAEGREISSRIQTLIQDGAKPSSCAVLIRRWSQARPILAALTEAGIPCEIVEGGDLLSRPEVRLVTDHLRLAASPGSSGESLLRLLSRAPALLDPDDLSAVFSFGSEAALRAPETVPDLSPPARERLGHLSGVLAMLEMEMAEADSLGTFVERTIEVTGLGHELRSSPEPEADLALQFLGIFRDVAAEFGDVRYIGEFIRYLEISADSRSSESATPPSGETDSVRVTTIHKAKGLEFDHVFIPGLSAKLFPEERTPASALATAQALPPSLEIHPEPDAAGAYEEMDVAALKASLARGTCEEEGRLFYVACTRARDTLTLSRAHYYRDNVRPKQPGAFWQLLLKAPQECAVHFAHEPEVPEINPNIEEADRPEDSQHDPWPIAAAAEGDDARIAAELGVEDWEDELSDLRCDVENIPARPRPRHVLPPPQTHSPSSLMNLETCARRYYYTYVFPVPFGSARMEESQEYGSAVLAWIEDGMQGDPPKPERVTRNGAVRTPTGAFATSEYALKASSYPLHGGADLPEQGPARMVEVSFAIEIGGSKLRGRIDAVFLGEDGTVHLIDWKTGRPHESYKRRLQLPLYALAANRLWSVDPERMCLAYVFIPGAERVEVEVGEGFLGSAEERVVDALNTIRSGAYDPSPSHHACSSCPVIGVGMEGCPTEVPEK